MASKGGPCYCVRNMGTERARFMRGETVTSDRTLAAIQFLRALAAFAVVAFHVQYDLVVKLSVNFPVSLDLGQAGVDLFFVISGFVMVYASESLFGRPDASITFFVRRIIRIVPLYWLMTSLMLAYVIARGFAASNASPMLALASYFFVPYPRPSGDVDPLYGIGWTLNYEMFFYLIFTLALFAARRTVVVAIVAIVLVGVVVIGQTAHLPPQAAFLASPIILEFAAGAGLALLYRTGFRLPPAVATVLLVAAIAEFAVLNSAWLDFSGMNSSVARPLQYGVPAAQGFAALTLIDRKLAFPYIEKLGDASYSLYLTHPAIISIARSASGAGYLNPAAAPLLFFTCMVAVCIAFAFVTWLLLERPVTAALKRRLAGAKPAIAATAA
jgi:exopolysaccharide production protein ExoZ